MKKLIIVSLPALLVCILLFLYLYPRLPNDSVEVSSPVASTKETEKTFTLISTGDIGLVRDVNNRIQQKKDPNYPFLKIADYLKSADLTVINMEGPIIKKCPIVLTGFTFCGESTSATGLKFAGVDAANLANNHSTNYGLRGLSETAEALLANDIKPFGQDRQIQYMDVNGVKLALVGFVELGNNWAGLNNAAVENVKSLNKIAAKNSDVVIDAFHWGVEYTTHPTKNQILLAHTAIDSGADIVLGNHPHWIQDFEVYNEKPIIYAQGNTIFDQAWSQETKEGVLYKFVYKNGQFEKIDEKFTIIEDNSQPRFATDLEIAVIKKRL